MTGVDVLLGSRAETSQATSCHLPLPAQPRQTGPAGVRKSQVDIISSARKLHRLHISHYYYLSALTTKPIIYIVRSSLSSLLSLSLLYFFQDRQKHLKCLEDVLKPLFG